MTPAEVRAARARIEVLERRRSLLQIGSAVSMLVGLLCVVYLVARIWRLGSGAP